MPATFPFAGIVDTMLGIPDGDREGWYEFLKPQLRDRESRERFEFPAQYMFREIPPDPSDGDPLAYTLAEMDRHGIQVAMVAWSEEGPTGRALRDHADRFVASVSVDPNQGVEALRAIRRGHEAGARSVQCFPAGCHPQVPIDDARLHPIYAACVELDLPVFVCAGVPGPRVPLACQHVERIDEVCSTFPELRFVIRHGAEPWADLAVELMSKWPNLSYSTSAFAPRYYPRAIIDYANGDGADQVLYAGYFPMGLSLERIMRELAEVPLRDDVWPKFLSGNARALLRLDP